MLFLLLASQVFPGTPEAPRFVLVLITACCLAGQVFLSQLLYSR